MVIQIAFKDVCDISNYTLTAGVILAYKTLSAAIGLEKA